MMNVTQLERGRDLLKTVQHRLCAEVWCLGELQVDSLEDVYVPCPVRQDELIVNIMYIFYV